MSARQTPHTAVADVPLDDIVVEGNPRPFIEPGKYQAVLVGWETHRTYKTPKVYLHFRIVDPGPAFEVEIFRAYRVSGFVGKPGRMGRFKLKRRSDLYLALCRLYEGRKLRPDRMSLRGLGGLVLIVSVRTVTIDARQRPLPECEHYSVVDALLDVAAGTFV